MGKRRPSGDGMVRKRDDGRWEGRIVVGHKANGDPIFRHVYAKTQKALTDIARIQFETERDSGVVGMDAAKAFFGAYTTISRADTAWS